MSKETRDLVRFVYQNPAAAGNSTKFSYLLDTL